MQALCLFEQLGDDFSADLDAFLGDENPPMAMQTYARGIVDDFRADRQAIDECIQSVVDNWELKRLAPVDRNIMRVAVCELMHRPVVPPKVAVNEAIEIGKEFGTKESASFINGILDAIVKRRAQSGPTTSTSSYDNNETQMELM